MKRVRRMKIRRGGRFLDEGGLVWTSRRRNSRNKRERDKPCEDFLGKGDVLKRMRRIRFRRGRNYMRISWGRGKRKRRIERETRMLYEDFLGKGGGGELRGGRGVAEEEEGV